MAQVRRKDEPAVPNAMTVAPDPAPVDALDAQRTVLLVDDVQYIRELAAMFLARTARVVSVGTAAEALDLARAEPPDLIVSDLRMPGMDGAELCRTLARTPGLEEIPFVMLVADDTGVDRGHAIRAGADDVLTKPLSRQSLVETVRRLLRGGSDRSLPRVALDVPVNVTASSETGDGPRERWIEKGVVRNLSRGGVFVETSCELASRAEVDLHFRLPDSADLLSPSAQVVWRQRPLAAQGSRHPSAGFGLRFVEVDGATSRRVDEFVYERMSGARPSAG